MKEEMIPEIGKSGEDANAKQAVVSVFKGEDLSVAFFVRSANTFGLTSTKKHHYY